MSGEDKAVGFFGDHIDSLKAFECLKLYINDFCPDAVISVQGSLLAFRTAAGFAYISLPSDDGSVLFNVSSIPTLVLFKNGEAVAQRVGGAGMGVLEAFINDNI